MNNKLNRITRRSIEKMNEQYESSDEFWDCLGEVIRNVDAPPQKVKYALVFRESVDYGPWGNHLLAVSEDGEVWALDKSDFCNKAFEYVDSFIPREKLNLVSEQLALIYEDVEKDKAYEPEYFWPKDHIYKNKARYV